MRVLIIGGGPAGATAAHYLAASGAEVTVLEKTFYPREKVCGDGLTPRAVRELVHLGVNHDGDGWRKTRGLRLIAGGRSMELAWPSLSSFPSYGLIRTRLDFDEALALHARSAGAKILEGHSVSAVVRDADGRVVGATGRVLDRDGRRGETFDMRADVVLACDGNSTRAAVSRGLHKRDDRPMGVAVRGYFESPRHEDDWMEGWLELPDASGRPLPGYGWVFGVGDGTVNVGLGILNSSAHFGKLDYKAVLRDWTASMPSSWEISPSTQVGEVRGAALPMGFNRTPHYVPGLFLVGDSGGMVSPFNGEGISYAMESARFAADVVLRGFAAGSGLARERVFEGYADIVRGEWGRHFTLGRAFAEVIGHPRVLSLALRAGMSIPVLMRFVVRMLANLTERPGTLADRVIRVLEAVVPSTSNTGGTVLSGAGQSRER